MLILLSILILLFIVYLMNDTRRPHNYPPGPKWWPIVGNVPYLKRLSRTLQTGTYAAFEYMARQHKTDILGLKLGNELVVVVESYETIKDILCSDNFNGRPDNFFLLLRCLGTKNGITCTEGNVHTVQRGFVVRHLRSLGFGRPPMDFMIQRELTNLMSTLATDSENGVNVGRHISPAIINILWTLTSGKRFERGDVQLNRLLDLLAIRSRAFDIAGGTLNQLPWLRHVAPNLTGYSLICRLNVELKQFLMAAIEEHQNTWTKDCYDDIMYAYISEMHKDANNASTTFTMPQLVMICLDLFVAGSETTSNILNFAFLTMLLKPEIQRKVQTYLDERLDINTPFQYGDRARIPYIEAVIMEVERYFTSLPLIGPRKTIIQTKLQGYSIPKNCTVLINVHSVHHDKYYWSDPEEFRPERFLDPTSGCLLLDVRLLTFSLGKRRCLGEVLARNCILTFFVEIMRRFHVTLTPDAVPLTGIPMPGITLSPEPYRARFIQRNTN